MQWACDTNGSLTSNREIKMLSLSCTTNLRHALNVLFLCGRRSCFHEIIEMKLRSFETVPEIEEKLKPKLPGSANNFVRQKEML